CHQRSSYPSTF
nr:immunoglobulin light chain junction region [Mus musculus]NSM00443.1 immunoglobulin light chain junction region [Mus musculus]